MPRECDWCAQECGSGTVELVPEAATPAARGSLFFCCGSCCAEWKAHRKRNPPLDHFLALPPEHRLRAETLGWSRVLPRSVYDVQRK